MISNVRAVHNDNDSVTEWLEELSEGIDADDAAVGHELDTEANRKLHSRLMSWLEQEAERQATNRYQMALDEDFYDSLQWSEEDAQVLMARKQAPLVFNQIKPTVDWLIGTEKRTRFDFKVLPREEDDVQAAEAKTKLLKYQSDVNKEAFSRSRAFADAIKAGMGIMEHGVRVDPTEEPVYDRYENWRNCLHDSNSYETDGSDMRYFFRWKYVDLDVAEALFPDRKQALRNAAISAQAAEDELNDSFWYLGAKASDVKDLGMSFNRHSQVNSSAYDSNRRERVRLIECWYRVPTRETVIVGAGMDGVLFDPEDETHARFLSEGYISVIEHVTMKVWCALMTEGALLQNVPSPYKHNRFPFTIIWGYRRKRDNLPYGVIRAIRDPQEDLNKRVSKSLHILSTKQVIMEAGAVDDIDELREEVAAPDGVIVRNRGKELVIQRDDFELQHQGLFMERDAAAIREVGGVTSENLGRDTNATSGRAIIAKQDQGGLVTAELFDNLLLAFKLSGEIKLSLTEQFYTDAKVIRIVGNRGKLEWLKVNYPDAGSTLNDITARSADFVVSEQDYRATIRMAMFETLADLVSKMPANISVQFLDLVIDVSDIPNKEEFIQRVRKINGHTDPTDTIPPEEAAAIEQAKMEQAELKQHMREMAQLEKAEKIANVKATEAKAASLMQPDVNALIADQRAALQQQFAQQLAEVQAAAEQQIATVMAQMQAVREEADKKLAEAKQHSVSEIVKAEIEQETAVRVAEINAGAQRTADALAARLDALTSMVQAKGSGDDGVEELMAKIDEISARVSAIGTTPAPEPQPITVNVQVDAKGDVKKSITVERDADGNITGASVVENGESS